MPVIIDRDGPGGVPLTVVESAAILLYLAEKGGRSVPVDPVGRVRCLEWLMFQAAGLGPMFGQSGYFLKLAPEKIPAAIERFHGEARRNMRVLDGRLAEATWLAGADYSIADIATFGWIWSRGFAEVDFGEAPHVARWFDAMSARPAVTRALALFGAEGDRPAARRVSRLHRAPRPCNPRDDVRPARRRGGATPRQAGTRCPARSLRLEPGGGVRPVAIGLVA